MIALELHLLSLLISCQPTPGGNGRRTVAGATGARARASTSCVPKTATGLPVRVLGHLNDGHAFDDDETQEVSASTRRSAVHLARAGLCTSALRLGL